MKDLTGQKFGRLKAIRENGRTSDQKVKWFCECKCGGTANVSSKNLLSGNSQSCGCLKNEKTSERTTLDLTNQRFGRLVALKQVGKRRGCWLWECRCNCGEMISVQTRSLRSGNTSSCGCLHSEIASNRLRKDITGQRFGRLVALERISKKHSHWIWLCRCDCEKIKAVPTSDLSSGSVRSCGCLKSEVTSSRMRKDITGQRFGRLVTLCSMEYRRERRPESVLWVCRCDCKKLHVASTGDLIGRNTQSCGCLREENKKAFGKIGSTAQAVLRELMQEIVTPERLREIQDYL